MDWPPGSDISIAKFNSLENLSPRNPDIFKARRVDFKVGGLSASQFGQRQRSVEPLRAVSHFPEKSFTF